MKSIDFNDVLRDNGVDVLRAMFDSVPSPSLAPADTPPAEPPPEDAAPELRSYQADVVERTEQQDGNVCLVAPTGAGKTIIGAAIIRAAVARGERVLVLAHTREIVRQTSSKLGTASIEHGVLMADETVRPDEPVQVASVQTYWARVMRTKRIKPPPADLIVVDECHHIRARTWEQIIKSYPDARLIGLTATPCRGDGRGLGSIFDVLVECPQVAELIRLGFLVPTKTYAPPESALNLKGVGTKNGDYVVSDLAKRVNTDPLVGDILTQWFKYASGLKTIVFAVDVAHSRHIANEFVKAGIATEHLDGKTPKRERDAILERLATGKTQVVTNCRVLTEGFDLPNIECIVPARPTKQQGLYRQMVGRGLRTAKGKSCLVVLDHSGAVYRHGCIEDEIEWTLSADKRAANRAHTTKPVRDTDGTYQSRLVDCKSCDTKRKTGEACFHCGYFPKPPAKAVVFEDGDLQLYDSNSRTATSVKPHNRDQWHAMLLHIAGQRGHKPGWAAYKFKEKFGVYPRWGWSPLPIPPSPEVSSWVRSRDIAHAKARSVSGRGNGK
jgi:DNA repair protein RadD